MNAEAKDTQNSRDAINDGEETDRTSVKHAIVLEKPSQLAEIIPCNG